MGLRDTAEADLEHILEDSAVGFGWPITVTDPDGTVGNLTGAAGDIAQLIDPDTGQAISGRLPAVTLRISSLTTAGLGLPVGISDPDIKPWLITFDDINGTTWIFKVQQSNPDRTLGVVTCLLEHYEA